MINKIKSQIAQIYLKFKKDKIDVIIIFSRIQVNEIKYSQTDLEKYLISLKMLYFYLNFKQRLSFIRQSLSQV